VCLNSLSPTHELPSCDRQRGGDPGLRCFAESGAAAAVAAAAAAGGGLGPRRAGLGSGCWDPSRRVKTREANVRVAIGAPNSSALVRRSRRRCASPAHRRADFRARAVRRGAGAAPQRHARIRPRSGLLLELDVGRRGVAWQLAEGFFSVSSWRAVEQALIIGAAMLHSIEDFMLSGTKT